MPRTLLACAALALLALLPGSPAGGEPVQATIRGAGAVNVRRGPGPDTAAIVVLRQGASVQVEERVGQWALVVLDDGERGYVNAAFLEVAAGAALPTEGAAGTPPADATPEPTATSIAAAPALDRELAALRERLATLEASMEGSGHPAADAGAAPAERPPVVVPTMVEPPASLEVGPSLALAGVGFLVGFLFGTFYGQRQERNRRMRVRF